MMTLPKGTILTVPEDTYLDGWADYPILEGYAEPVFAGDIKLSLGIESSDIWKDWNQVLLDYFPELKCRVQYYIESLPFGDTRDIWLSAFNMGRLPPINGFIPKFEDDIGTFTLGKAASIAIMPFIEHTENVLRPLGQSTDESPKKLYSPLLGGYNSNHNRMSIPSNFVLLAQRASIHKLEDVPMYTSNDSNADIPSPPTISMQLLVCTKTYYPSIPLTHKLIIKE